MLLRLSNKPFSVLQQIVLQDTGAVDDCIDAFQIR